MDSVNLNDVSLYSADFEFLINPNRDKKHRFIGIVSNIPDFPAKVIFSTNQICADRQFYDDKPRIIGGKQQLVTTDGRESCMFISDDLAYLPFR